MTISLTIKQSNSFKKSVKKLSKQQKLILDEQVRMLLIDPMLGQQKKGDLDFLRVHKFKCFSQEFLLGYMYEEGEFTLTLLKLGSHENFYRDMKK